MVIHIGLDVDGTLSAFGGPIQPATCKWLAEKGCRMWMASIRDNEQEARRILDTYHLEQCGMNRVYFEYSDIKREMLRVLKARVASEGRLSVVYVGDKTIDLVIAMQEDVIYCRPEYLSENILPLLELGEVRVIM